MLSSKNPSHKKVYKFTKANLDRLNELFNFVPWICAFLTDNVQGPVSEKCNNCIPEINVSK